MDSKGYKKFLEAKEELAKNVAKITRKKRLISLAIGNPEKTDSDSEFIDEEIEFLKQDEVRLKQMKDLIELLAMAFSPQKTESKDDEIPY